jgi:hypothetical protein
LNISLDYEILASFDFVHFIFIFIWISEWHPVLLVLPRPPFLVLRVLAPPSSFSQAPPRRLAPAKRLVWR